MLHSCSKYSYSECYTHCQKHFGGFGRVSKTFCGFASRWLKICFSGKRTIPKWECRPRLTKLYTGASLCYTLAQKYPNSELLKSAYFTIYIHDLYRSGSNSFICNHFSWKKKDWYVLVKWMGFKDT